MRLGKLFLALLLTGLMAAFVLPAGANADGNTAEVTALSGAQTLSDGVIASGSCGNKVTWTLTDDGTLTISGSGPIKRYGLRGAPWYLSNNKISRIEIQSGVTAISSYLFSYHSTVTSISISSTVTSIDSNAFFMCDNLASITVDAANPNYCTVGNVLYSKDMTELLFCGSDVTNMVIPNGVTFIHPSAFNDHSKLESISIPNTVTEIGLNAFYRCSGLKSLHIPSSVNKFESGFENNPFSYCSSMTELTVAEGNPYFCAKNNLLYNKNMTKVLGCAGGLTSATIASSVTKIGEGAFACCTKLTSVTIPDGVTTIGAHAFESAYNLLSFSFPSSVTQLGDYVFNFSGLKVGTIVFQGDAPSISRNCFWLAKANIYYPKGNATYTDDVKQNYGGTLTWKEMGGTKTPTIKDVTYQSDGVKVQWGAEENVLSYRLQYKVSGGSYKTLANLTSTSYTIPADMLSCGTKYYFRVRSQGVDGTTTSYSDAKYMTYLVPPVVKDVTSTAAGIQVTWEPVKGAEGYAIKFTDESENHSFYIEVGADKTSCVVTNSTAGMKKDLTSGMKYNIEVGAFSRNSNTGVPIRIGDNSKKSIVFEKVYEVTYDANGGSGAPSSQTKFSGKSIKLSSTVPTRKGYTFAGWATSATGSVKYQPGDKYTSNASKTLYAKWTAHRYTIKFNGNGKTGGSMSSMADKKYGSSYTLTANAYTRTGYDFIGWNTKADGSGTSYKDGASVKNLSSKDGGSITLYAQWKLKTYKVTFDANGGKSAPSAQTKTYGKTLTLPTTKPTRSGYSFQGWATSATSTTVKYKAGASYTSNSSKTLYAVWKKK